MSAKDRILCIDDDGDQLALLHNALTRLSYVVVTNSSPTAALEEATRSRFHAVVTDLGMGEMDGLELCRRVVATQPDVPVIVLSWNESANARAVRPDRAGGCYRRLS